MKKWMKSCLGTGLIWLFCVFLFAACQNADDSQLPVGTDPATTVGTTVETTVETTAELTDTDTTAAESDEAAETVSESEETQPTIETADIEETEEPETEPEEKTVSIDAAACAEELWAAYEVSVKQDTMQCRKNGWECVLGFDENGGFLYQHDGIYDGWREDIWTQQWLMTYENEYRFYVRLSKYGETEQYYEVLEENPLVDAETKNEVVRSLYLPVENTIRLVEQNESAVCLKTKGEVLTYQIRMTVDDLEEMITVTIADGLIVGYACEMGQQDVVAIAYGYGEEISPPALPEEHFHFYEEATCYAPITCRDCGATQGEPKHEFTAATCTAPCTCVNCGETIGIPLDHEISSLTSRCVNCGEFEYNEEYIVRKAVESTQEWLDDPTVVDSYQILNVYYVPGQICWCDKCLVDEYVGEPYLMSIVFVEYTLNGETYRFCDIRGAHKYTVAESDTHYMLVMYSMMDYEIEFEGDDLLRLDAWDGSFCYDRSVMIEMPLEDLLT